MGTEFAGLKEGWREPAAWLLGLKRFLAELDAGRWPDWPEIKYTPAYMTLETRKQGLTQWIQSSTNRIDVTGFEELGI